MALGRWLPLDHNGLVGPAAGNDVLRRGRGGLLGEGDPGKKSTRSGWVFPLRLEGRHQRSTGCGEAEFAMIAQSLSALGRVA